MPWSGALAWRRYPRMKPEEGKVLISHPTHGVMEAEWRDEDSPAWLGDSSAEEGFVGLHNERLDGIEFWSPMPPGPEDNAEGAHRRLELKLAAERAIERDVQMLEEQTGDTVVDISFEESRQRQVIVHIRRK